MFFEGSHDLLDRGVDQASRGFGFLEASDCKQDGNRELRIAFFEVFLQTIARRKGLGRGFFWH